MNNVLKDLTFIFVNKPICEERYFHMILFNGKLASLCCSVSFRYSRVLRIGKNLLSFNSHNKTLNDCFYSVDKSSSWLYKLLQSKANCIIFLSVSMLMTCY